MTHVKPHEHQHLKALSQILSHPGGSQRLVRQSQPPVALILLVQLRLWLEFMVWHANLRQRAQLKNQVFRPLVVRLLTGRLLLLLLALHRNTHFLQHPVDLHRSLLHYQVSLKQQVESVSRLIFEMISCYFQAISVPPCLPLLLSPPQFGFKFDPAQQFPPLGDAYCQLFLI